MYEFEFEYLLRRLLGRRVEHSFGGLGLRLGLVVARAAGALGGRLALAAESEIVGHELLQPEVRADDVVGGEERVEEARVRLVPVEMRARPLHRPAHRGVAEPEVHVAQALLLHTRLERQREHQPRLEVRLLERQRACAYRCAYGTQ